MEKVFSTKNYSSWRKFSQRRIIVRWESFFNKDFSRQKLEIQCHPICNWLYVHVNTVIAMHSDHRIFSRDTGWRRPIGCLKLQAIFRKRATNYRALLRKMTYRNKAFYDCSPPCTACAWKCWLTQFLKKLIWYIKELWSDCVRFFFFWRYNMRV